MADTRYLLQRRQTWYVKVKVPTRLQKLVGSTHIVRTLKTRSLPEAQQLRHAAVAQIKAELEALEKSDSRNVLQEALMRRQSWLNADSSDPDPEYGFTAQDEALDDIIEAAKELEERKGADVAGSFVRIATSNSPLLVETLETWLLEASKTLTNQTAYQYKSDTERFIEWAKTNKIVMVAEVTKRIAGKYVSNNFDGLSAKTINRHISSLSTWWRWLDKKGMAEDNPWRGQSLATKGNRGGGKAPRRQYTTAEMVTLLKGLEERPLGALFRLGLFSGARLDELCSLTIQDVLEREDGLWLAITEGKTDNAVRTIPVHSSITSLVRQLQVVAKATPGNAEGWLFPGLTPGGPDMKRSANVTKRFTRVRRKLQVDDPATVFHSTRKNLSEALEAAEVPLHTAKLLVGHERGDMTYGRYSKGELVNLRVAIEKVMYPKEVMEAL